MNHKTILLQVLVVEDSEDDTRLMVAELRRGGFAPAWERVETGDAMRAALARQAWDIVLADYTMPKFDAPTALRILLDSGQDIPFIVVSGSIGEDIAVRMMKQGANDYVLKRDLTRFIPAVERELRDAENRRRQRQAERALRESEQRFRHIADSAGEWIWEVDANGLYTFASPVVESILGYKPEEIVGRRHFYDLFAPAVREELKAAVFAAFARKQSFRRLVNRNLHKNGREVLLETSAVPVLDERGELRGYRGADTDITERKQAGENLRASEARLQQQFDYMPVACIAADPQCRITAWNPAAEKTFGYPAAAMLGRPLMDLVPPFAAAQVTEVLQHVLRGQDSVASVNENLRPDGRRILCEWTNTPLRTAEGAVIGLLCMAHDVTERQRAEEALKLNQAQLIEAMRIARMGYWEYDVPANQFIFNDQFYAMLHTTAEREGGYAMSPSEYTRRFVHPADAAVVGVETQKCLAVTDPNYNRELDHRVIFGDGQVGYINVHIRLEKNAQGRTIKTHGVNMDITQRKLAEEALAKERALLQTLMLNLPDGIYFKDSECRFTQINPAQARRFGLNDLTEAVGKTDFDFFTAEHAREAYEDEQTILHSGEPLVDKEEKETWPDGRVTWVATTKMPLRNETGEIAGTFGVSRDITERKRGEESLRLFRYLVDQSLDAVMLVEPETGRFLDVNEEACRLFQYPRDELLQRSVPEMAPTLPSREAWQAQVREFQTRGPGLFEFPARRKDGTKFPAEISARLVEVGGRSFFIGILRDITQRKLAEDQLKCRNEELERFNRASVGRELRMVELKQQINRLQGELGRSPVFPLEFMKDDKKTKQPSEL